MVNLEVKWQLGEEAFHFGTKQDLKVWKGEIKSGISMLYNKKENLGLFMRIITKARKISTPTSTK